MKNPSKSFTQQYPYLTYWTEGCRFDKETIEALEEEYKTKDIK
jgi:hypothetical protein